jgi:hypothetical protein
MRRPAFLAMRTMEPTTNHRKWYVFIHCMRHLRLCVMRGPGKGGFPRVLCFVVRLLLGAFPASVLTALPVAFPSDFLFLFFRFARFPLLQASWRRVAQDIRAASGPFLFPGNLSLLARYAGRWALQQPAEAAREGTRDAAGVVHALKPRLAPNLTVEYGLYGGASAPSLLGFGGAAGSLLLHLQTEARIPQVPTLQRVQGVMVLMDDEAPVPDPPAAAAAAAVVEGDAALTPPSASASPGARDRRSQRRRRAESSSYSATDPYALVDIADGDVSLPLSGLYIADEGLLVLVGSRKPAMVGVVPLATAPPSPGPLVVLADGVAKAHSPSPSPQPQASAAADSQSPQAESEAQGQGRRAAAGAGAGAGNMCDFVVALRMRPIGLKAGGAGGGGGRYRSASSSAGRSLAAADTIDLDTASEVQDAADSDLFASLPLLQWASHKARALVAGAFPALAPALEALAPRVASAAMDDAGLAGEAAVAGRRRRLQDLFAAGGDAGSADALGAVGWAALDSVVSASGGANSAGSATGRLLGVTSLVVGPPSTPSARFAAAATGTTRAAAASETSVGPASLGADLSDPSGGWARQYPGARIFPLHGRALSPNCNVTLNVSASAIVWSQAALEDKAMGYTLLATTTGAILIAALTMQIVASASESAAARVSLATIGIQAMTDAYLTLLHLVGGFVAPAVFGSFATTAFVNLLLFSVLEMRFLLLIWKARRPGAFAGGWDNARREIGSLYCRFYIAMVGGLVLVYFGSWAMAKLLLLLACSFWWPQILHTARTDSRSGLSPKYILATSVCRLLLPLYFLACPTNLFYLLSPPETRATASRWSESVPFAAVAQPFENSGSPASVGLDAGSSGSSWFNLDADTYPAFASPESAAAFRSSARFAVFLTVWMAVQVGILLLQGKSGFGPRFFVPRVLQPRKYDYHRAVDVQSSRIIPNPADTLAWIRPTHRVGGGQAAAGADNDAAAPGGGQDGAVPLGPDGQPLTRLQEMRLTAGRALGSARQSGREALATAQWIGATVRLVVTDVRDRIRARGGLLRSMLPAFLARRLGPGPTRYVPLDRVTSVRGRTSSDAAAAAAIGGESDALSRNGRTVISNPLSTAAAPVDAESASGSIDTPSGATVDVEQAQIGSDGAVSGMSGPGDGSTIDCVVCMTEMAFPMRRADYMVTPCDHIFHQDCLKPWIDQKLECPTCRMVLPEP